MKSKIEFFLKSRIFINSTWLFILQIFNTILPLITLPYVTRILGASNYGVFSLSLNWITYFQIIVEYGFGFTGARKVSIGNTERNKLNLQKLYSNIITARIILLFIAYILMNSISIFTHISINQYISMNILFMMVIGVTFQLTWLFQGMQNMKIITIINVISRVFSVILIFLLVKEQKHIYVYCFCYSITFILSAFIGIIYANKKYGLKIKVNKITEVFLEIKDGWDMFISQAISKIFSGFGITILGFVTTSNMVGVYSAISKIPFVLILFFSPINQALFPYISIQFNNSFNKGENIVKKFLKYTILGFCTVGLGIIFFREEIVNIIFGENYQEYADLIIPLIIWTIISIVNNFLGPQYLVASGNSRLYSKAFSISIMITILLNITLGYKYNIYGIAFASVLGEFLLMILLIFNIYVNLKRKDL